MAQEFVVSFRGDLGNLKQFTTSIEGSLRQVSQQVQAANTKLFSDALGQSFNTGGGAGLFVKNQKAVFDSVSNSIRQSADIYQRTISGYKAKLREGRQEIAGMMNTGDYELSPLYNENFISSVNKNIANAKKLLPLFQQLEAVNQQILQTQAIHAQRRIDAPINAQTQAAQIRGQAGVIKDTQIQNIEAQAELEARSIQAQIEALNLQKANIAALQQKLAIAEKEYATQIRRNPAYYQGAAPLNLSNQAKKDLDTQAALEKRQLAQQSLQQGTTRNAGIDQSVTNLQTQSATRARQFEQYTQSALSQYNAEDARATQLIAGSKQFVETLSHLEEQQALERLHRQAAGLEGRVGQGLLAPAAIHPELQSLLTSSPQVAKQLQKAGLAGGVPFQPGTEQTPQFLKNLEAQGAKLGNFVRDMRTGITTANVEFGKLDAAGNRTAQALQRTVVAFDDSGKAITTMGGRFRGANSFLQQTGRDLVKVAQFAIGTSIVFGTLGVAVKSLQTINELNANLTRLGITSQLSSTEVKSLFKDLATVAIQTATPLTDIVKAADDIALAVRKPGQSVQDLRTDIIDLTTAVGIFTNLSGVDTVKATDLLTAAFKQLSIAPADLPTLLSKITAAAGGQSQAIADITQAVGSVSGAAREAGLSVDQIIGAVQTLSQVTSKSPADVATAFKNLFGAISSPGSVKILKEFNIAVYDTNGNLRNFLDIYHDIASSINQGIIPQGRVQDVLRGISGGPRRAPDAAALLSNITKVDQATQQSANASNEALIANAQILDTNQAKIIQFQNAFNTVVFEKFGEAVRQLTITLTDLGTTLLKIFRGVPTELISFGLQLGVIAGGVKLLGAGLRNILIPAFKGLTDAMKGATIAGEAQQLTMFGGGGGTPAGGGGGGLLGRVKSLGLGKLAIGAGVAVGAGAALASGNTEAASGLLQIAGIASLALGVFPPLGVAALVLSQALGGVGQRAKEAADREKTLEQGTYQLIQRYQQAAADLETFKTQQADLGKQLDGLRTKTKLTADEQIQLNGLYIDYVDAALNVANANNNVSDSFDALLSSVGKLDNSNIQAIINAAKGGILSPEDRKTLTSTLANNILAAGNSGFIIPNTPLPINLNAPNLSGKTGSGQVSTSPYSLGYGPDGKPFFGSTSTNARTDNLSTFLGSDPKNVLSLFSYGADGALHFTAALDGTRASLFAVQQALLDNKDALGSSYVPASIALEEYINKNDLLLSVLQAVQQQQALNQANQAVGVLSGADLKNATGNTNAAVALTKLLGNAPTVSGGYAGEGAQRIANPTGPSQGDLSKNIQFLIANNSKSLGGDKIKEIATQYLAATGALEGLNAEGQLAVDMGIGKVLEAWGFSAADAAKAVGALAAQQIRADKAAEEFGISSKKALSDYAARTADLIGRQNSGEFDKNKTGLAQLKEQNLDVYKSSLKVASALKNLETLSPTGLADFEAVLARIPGFQDAVGLSSEDLISRFSQLALQFGLTGDQAIIFGNQLVNLMKASRLLSETKAVLGITVELDTTTAIAKLKAFIAAYEATAALFGKSGRNQFDVGPLFKALDLLDQLEKLPKPGKTPTGKGNKLGQLPSIAKVKQANVSLLDIPNEIADASNEGSLIKQAIANAKKLQSQIPGQKAKDKNDIVELLDGTKKVAEVRGISEQLLRKALDELSGKIQKQIDLATKADTIQRIRVGNGSFAALANVPLNSQTGVSVGGPGGPIQISLNINGQVLTPAQFDQLANLIGAALKKQLAG